MNQEFDEPMTFADGSANTREKSASVDGFPFDAPEEFDWLMSLALDDALNEQEATKFEMMLRHDPANLDRWASWQAVDNNFRGLPMAVPTTDFCDRFALKLEIQERQHRLRTGVIFGLVAVALWVSVFSGVIMLGAMLWSNQGAWMNSAVQDVTYWWSAVGQLGRSLFNTGEALWSEPLTRALVVCYVATVAAILSGWFVFLRRSTRVDPLYEPQFVEA